MTEDTQRSAAKTGTGRGPVPWVLVLAAAAVLWAGFTHGAFRDAEGFLTGSIALPLGLAAGLLALAVTERSRVFEAGRWAALALAGQGAMLSLIDAGNMVAYQHLRVPSAWLDGVGGLATLVLVVQTGLLIALGRGVLTGLARGLLSGWGPMRSAGIAIVFLLTSATLSAELPRYAVELLLATALQGLQLWTVAVAAYVLPETVRERYGASVWRLIDGPTAGSGRLPWVLAGWTLVVAAVLSWFAYQRHPHVPDEVVYILHARYFAAGLLELPLPPLLAAFDLDLMTVDTNRWFSPVPPGWPAMLAVGVWLGAFWLVNPVLGAVCVLLTHTVVHGIYQDRRVARLTTILLATSPWFLFMCMNYMTHTFALLTGLIGTWGVLRLVRGGSRWWTVVGGIGIGLVALNRPLEGLVAAGLLGLWCLLASGTPIRTAIGRTIGLAAATLATVSITFPYNRHFTGSATHFPIMDYADRVYGVGTNAMGFGANRGLGWPGLDPFMGHDFVDVLINANLNIYQVNVELLGWGVGSLLVLALAVLGGRLFRADWMMIAVVIAVAGAHSFYWFSGGPDFGARYWYLILVPCLALGARGLLALSSDDRAGSRTWTAATVLVVGVVCVFLPWRAIDKYHHYRAMRPEIRQLAQTEAFGEDALVLIRGNRHPDYASAAIYNPLDLTGPGPLYVWDRDEETREAVLARYPDRTVWLVDGPTVSGAGFVVVDGPLPASEVANGGGDGP